MTVAEHNINSALVTRQGSPPVLIASVLLEGAQIRTQEPNVSKNTVPDSHHIGWGSQFRFINGRESRKSWNKSVPGNKAAVQTKGVGAISRPKHTINIIIIAAE